MWPQTSAFYPDILAKRSRLSPYRTALRDTLTGQRLTFQAWEERVCQTANFLQERCEIQPGDRIAVYAINSLEYLDLWMACTKVGAILQNLNWRLTTAELLPLILDAQPKVMCYSADFATQITALRPQLPLIKHWIALDAPADPSDLLFSRRESSSTTFHPIRESSPDDPWVICYTGGTTGLPKGAVLTQGNMLWNAINTVISWGLDQNDVAILNAPLFHTGGLNVFTLPLIYAGGTSLVCRKFDPDQTFDLIESAGVTVFFGVPTMFIALQNHPRWESADFSHTKLIISGGAPCPLPVFEKFWDKGVDFKTGYGLTEAGPNTFWLPAEDVRRKPAAVGFPLMHIDVKVVRPDGSLCAVDEGGELLIRGPHVTPGYWNNPDATSQVVIDGWLHTGDLATRDEEGYYRIIGRIKDLIISGGENIYPAEVESAIHAHPAVAEAALIGVPDPKWGEVGRAVIVLKPGETLDETGLITFLRERLAGYKVPKTVVFVEELPKTGAGKIDKISISERWGKA